MEMEDPAASEVTLHMDEEWDPSQSLADDFRPADYETRDTCSVAQFNAGGLDTSGAFGAAWRPTRQQVISTSFMDDSFANQSNQAMTGRTSTGGRGSGGGVGINLPVPREASEHQQQERAAQALALSDEQGCMRWLRECSPSIHAVLKERGGRPWEIALITLYVFSELAAYSQHRPGTEGGRGQEKANPFFVVTVMNLLSLVIAIGVSVFKEDARAPIWSWTIFMRFVGVGYMFGLSQLMVRTAFHEGATAGFILTIGYIYLPICAVLSLFVLKRTYGMLEWLALFTMALGIVTFVLLRSASVDGPIQFNNWLHLGLVSGSASLSAVASVYSERCYKNRSQGINAEARRASLARLDRPFWIYKVHLDFASLTMSAAIWVAGVLTSQSQIIPDASTSWVGEFDWLDLLVVLTGVLQGWLVGIITKHYSTVFRAIVESFVTVLAVFVVDPLYGNHGFEGGVIPCGLLTIIIVASALIFQTGRNNLQLLKQRLGYLPRQRRRERVSTALQSFSCSGICRTMLSYSVLAVFIATDAGRTLSQSLALGTSSITPQTMVVASYISGVLFATIMIFFNEQADLKKNLMLAYSPYHIMRYFPSAALFSISSTLMSLAYTYGVSAAVSTAVGYIYMPVSAIASAVVLGKYYLALEWFGLVTLTAAASVFGFLQDFFKHKGKAGEASSLVGPGLVVLSSVVSVFASLVAERLLKKDQLPFHIQKVRLDMGSVIASVVVLPICGLTSQRPIDAFWKFRPVDMTCPTATSTCWNVNEAGYCGAAGCECECQSGVLVGWSNLAVIVALVIFVAQGWMTGVVIKRFSTVLRAIAQATTLLVIYFIGDPIVQPKNSIFNLPLTLVALVIPLSTCVFILASSEMAKVWQTTQKSIAPSENGNGTGNSGRRRTRSNNPDECWADRTPDGASSDGPEQEAVERTPSPAPAG
eukprot:TRINITY_DN47361_c0_g1_i2.p1 TRINITY_DN47361_c0_g1~~TRINITY_DN47361_c0_g1_i2.p1  ORF type:complete len:933 (+),score=181.44 TRINITY_DN47361_c0_g1_i2:82-2880(+)